MPQSAGPGANAPSSTDKHPPVQLSALEYCIYKNRRLYRTGRPQSVVSSDHGILIRVADYHRVPPEITQDFTHMRVDSLITGPIGNAKLLKSVSKHSATHVPYIQYLAPNIVAREGNVCPGSTPGCRASCLNLSGIGRTVGAQLTRIARTRWYVSDRGGYTRQLQTEIDRARKRTVPQRVLCIRLNGTSDIAWFDVIQRNPDVVFYDYTKVAQRFEEVVRLEIRNYHLTYSASESPRTHETAFSLVDRGYNAAFVFDAPTHDRVLTQGTTRVDQSSMVIATIFASRTLTAEAGLWRYWQTPAQNRTGRGLSSGASRAVVGQTNETKESRS